jgi:ribosome maturation factor RimP
MSQITKSRQRLRALLEPTVQSLGFDLVAVEWTGDRTSRILRLSIDGPAGVGIHDCARISSTLSPLLDAEDPTRGAYRLEVSSPGIERPVERLVDFERFVGFRVKIRLEEGHARRGYTGTLEGVEDDEVLVQVDGTTHRLLFETIERAHLDLDLEQYERLAATLYGADEPENTESAS